MRDTDTVQLYKWIFLIILRYSEYGLLISIATHTVALVTICFIGTVLEKRFLSGITRYSSNLDVTVTSTQLRIIANGTDVTSYILVMLSILSILFGVLIVYIRKGNTLKISWKYIVYTLILSWIISAAVGSYKLNNSVIPLFLFVSAMMSLLMYIPVHKIKKALSESLSDKPRYSGPTNIIIIILIILMSAPHILTGYRTRMINNLDNKLKQPDSLEGSTENSGNNNYVKPYEDSSDSTGAQCSTFSGSIAASPDEKFYLTYNGSRYSICDNSNPENPVLLSLEETSVQYDDILIITIYGDQMFFADTNNKTLKYIDINDFPDKNEYLNTDGTPDLWLFGPRETSRAKISPNKDKLIFGASTCHDCDTVIKDYVINLNTLEITPLGYGNNSAVWRDNNTVSWTEVYTREKTQEELKEDPYGFPVVYELGEKRIKKF